jgi:L-iditol 2-dehydrogenase
VLGGFAEQIAAPAGALHGIPEGLPAAAAATAEPLAAAIHALSRGTDAEDVGIVGGGSMGLMLAALLHAEGRSVTLADRHAARREQAAAFGARTAPALARHDLVFEAVGRPEAWRAALDALRPGGTAVLVGGCPKGTDVPVPATPVHYDELELRGSFHHSPAEVDQALALLGDGGLDWRALLGPTITLHDLPQALAQPRGGPARKWVIDPRQ